MKLPAILIALTLAACGAEDDATQASSGAGSGLPMPRGGAALIGTNLADLRLEQLDGESLALARTHDATLLRWWTDTCPFCCATLPALEALRREYGALGLEVVAVYHPKSAVALSDEAIRAAARERGFEGRVAVDRDWSALERAWPTSERSATSVALLLDSSGVVRFAHPGPEFHASDDPEHRECARDFADLRAALELVLAREHEVISDPAHGR
jgi:thiol-disulfide isomerase/thioredoxin